MSREEITWTVAGVAAASVLALGIMHLAGQAAPGPSREGGGRPMVDRQQHPAPGSADRAVPSAQGSATARSASGSPPGDRWETSDQITAVWEDFESWAADDLRARFGASIESPATQVTLLELRAFLQESDPDGWETKLDALLRKAFPDHADAVQDTFARMDAYDAWFEANRRDLATLTSGEIREILRQRRAELFGEGAAEIWRAESGAGHLRDSLEILEGAEGVPLEDKLALFGSAVGDFSPDEARAPLAQQRQAMAAAFLSLESVQDDLRRLSPEARAASLREIRASLGMDEQAVEALEALDAEREERWEKGLRYMEERAVLTADYEGPTLERELRFLRERYFPRQAQTIAAEESRGFFRYARRRVYGRN